MNNLIKYWVRYRVTVVKDGRVIDGAMGIWRAFPISEPQQIASEIMPAIANQVAVDEKLEAGTEMSVTVYGWQRFEDLIQIASSVN